MHMCMYVTCNVVVPCNSLLLLLELFWICIVCEHNYVSLPVLRVLTHFPPANTYSSTGGVEDVSTNTCRR